MVKTNMSTDGSENELDTLALTKGKINIQQRLIDISARTLQSTRLSSRDFSPGSRESSGDAQSAIEENIVLLENKLMRGFARQLYLKHEYQKQANSGDEDNLTPQEAERELDQSIDFGLFLNIACLVPRAIKALQDTDLSLDAIFAMPPHELYQLLAQYGVSIDDARKLQSYLDMLRSYYAGPHPLTIDQQLPPLESWERGEKPTMSPYERLSSTSSRLSSVSTQGSIDHDTKTESCSSYLASPFSSLSAPSPLTHSTPNTSLLTPSPHTAVSLSHSSIVNGGNGQTQPLERSYSSSSTVLYPEVDYNLPSRHSTSSVSESRTPSRYNRKFTHHRSHSNPLANIIITDSNQHVVNGRSRVRSPTPPSRCDSQPSIVSQSAVTTGPPSPMMKNKGHPQMRRIWGLTPTFSQSISNDVLIPSPTPTPTTPESPIFKQNVYYPDHTPRCNSLASGEPRRSYSHQPRLIHKDITSSSMVDLPYTMAASSEHLDQISENSLPKSGKSQSVPRLTLMSVSMESEKGVQGAGSTSVPTSPRAPGMYAGRMGHSVGHRFTTKTYLTSHICDYCKKSLKVGLRCKDCKYICHKVCSTKAPPSCGLPRELMDFFRQQVQLTSTPASIDSYISSSDHYAQRPHLEKSSTYDADTRELLDSTGAPDQFVIQELTREPTKAQFSPVMGQKKLKNQSENGRTRRQFFSQTSAAMLEVPLTHHHHSTSSSPSTSPPTSPSLTPSSPRSPNDYNTYSKVPEVIYTDDDSADDNEMNELLMDAPTNGLQILSEDDSQSPYSSRDSLGDISDMARMHADSPQGLRPPPQVVLAKSLPDLLMANGPPKLADSSDGGISSMSVNSYTSSYDNLLHQKQMKRKESLQRTLSTTDSKTSTLVASQPTEGEDDYDYGSQEVHDERHRNSMVDEWNIPYDDIRIMDLIGRGPVGEVYRGYWHGEVAIKRFCLHNPTPEQLNRFKEEVAILKKTRHENLALFMGASLTPPNLAIMTSFCRGQVLYKHIHLWSEVFSLDKIVHIAKQITLAMGYLHARGIVHKNVNTKNIFLEKDRVIITDTGLSSLTDSICLQQLAISPANERRFAIVPRTKLYYLAPEIMRVLSPCPEVQENGDLYPYTDKTDVYAFGTVLYELITRKFPFTTDSLGLPLDTTTVIFLVGSGQRQEILTRETPKRIKDLVMDCWHKDPLIRLSFKAIWDCLTKLSRRKTPIARSPSFPITLSRSTESLRVL